ncbi:MAG: type IV pilus assembly protein PilM [Lentisphaeria bacterium]|nr:type IV pilus assembly protein PilM [Lentisphaeria bacterium]
MAQQNLILCIDIGGDSIKAAEFSYVPGQSLNLERFAYTEYEFSSDEPPEDVILKTLADVIKTNGFSARDVYVSISGKNAFVRFVKIPAMTTDKDKIQEIISYEAQQAIPFSSDEVVWDSQLLQPTADADGSEIDAMIVIVKKQEVSRISELVEKLGKRIALIEVAGTSCYNSARANNVGANECQMILDIGGRCSTLIFIDGSRFFVRTIPIAGDTITQQIAKEFNISYADAEEMKRKHGYVSLGGAYEESDSEVASAVSKIVRNVMTRLHGEINRSINVYRATQKGRKPEKLFLAGGTSILPYAPRFFSEKLRIPVEYLNPFQVVGIGPAVDQQVLSEVAHLFAETIGLALRRIGTSPIEISLIPDYVRKQNEFRSKRPFFFASAAVVLLFFGITLWTMSQQADNIAAENDKFSSYVMQREAIQKRVKDANSKLAIANSAFGDAVDLLKKRNNLIAFYSLIKTCIPDNVWLTDFSISNAPSSQIKSATAVANAADNPETAQNNAGGQLTMDMPGEENPDPTQQNAEGASNALTWINMVAYVICDKSDTRLNDRSAAINNITSKMNSDYKSIFKAGDADIKIVYDEGRDICDNLTICKFLLAVELKEPVDSPEFEQLLAKKFSPVASDDEEVEEEEE